MITFLAVMKQPRHALLVDCLITSKWQLVTLAGEYRPKISTGWPMQSWAWAEAKREMNGQTLVLEITPEGRPRQLLEQGLSAE
ncbi:hypothetical protein FOZ62_011000, partial [Perkinsus olseni]